MENNVMETISKSIENLSEGMLISNILIYITQFFLTILLGFAIYYLINIGNTYLERDKKVDVGKKEITYYIIIIFTSLVLILMFEIRAVLFSILSPFIFAMILAYILSPAVKFVEKRGVSRLLSVLLVYISISITILIISITIVPRISNEIKELVESLPEFTNEVYDYSYDLYMKFSKNVDNLPSEFDGVKNILEDNTDRMQKFIVNTISGITNSLLAVFSKIVSIVLVPILAFYFLKDTTKIKKSLILTIPKKYRVSILEIVRDLDEVLGGFITGQLIVAAFIGILTTIALLVLGVRFAIIVGFIAGIANVIPYFGPIIGIVPGVLFALLDSPTKALWVLGIFVAIQQIESAILSPKIVGNKVGIHPIIVILVLLTGGKLFGVVGLMIAIPLAGTIKVFCKHFMKYIVNSK
ncbi:MAG: AI-2E family transporter [Alkaliphilus sp.]|nr:MAG: AI-2E family transporter [Alkaliphilus sp.]